METVSFGRWPWNLWNLLTSFSRNVFVLLNTTPQWHWAYSPLVPIHTWSASSLKVSRTLLPDLLYMPVRGTEGRDSRWFLMPGKTSSGLPYLSNTFLWSCGWKGQDLLKIWLCKVCGSRQRVFTPIHANKNFPCKTHTCWKCWLCKVCGSHQRVFTPIHLYKNFPCKRTLVENMIM